MRVSYITTSPTGGVFKLGDCRDAPVVLADVFAIMKSGLVEVRALVL